MFQINLDNDALLCNLMFSNFSGTPCQLYWTLDNSQVQTSDYGSPPVLIDQSVSFVNGSVNPISGVSFIAQPSDQQVCETFNADFTVGVSSLNSVSYQWQESSDQGATWVNLTNYNFSL